MKIKNEMDYNEVCNAVKLWACNADGYNGAIGGIFEQIPWGNDIQSIRPWDDVEERFNNVIPSCPNFDYKKIILGDKEIITNLNEFARKITYKITDVYEQIIDEINNKNMKKVIIEKVVGVDKGFVHYEVYDTLSGFYWIDIFEHIFSYFGLNHPFVWEDKEQFIDICFESLYKNMSCHLGGNYYLKFPKK